MTEEWREAHPSGDGPPPIDPAPEPSGALWLNGRATHDRAKKVEARTLPTVDASALAGMSIPPRLWHVEGMIPASTVTLLGGDGGTGKSLLAEQLAVSTVLGRPWIGRDVRQGRCLFLTAEDDLDEVHRRLVDIASDNSVTLEDLSGLTLSSLAGEDAVLAAVDGRSGVVRPTPLFAALKATTTAERPALIVLDTLSDLFAGDENQRTQARQFIGMLRGLALQSGAAVVLLAHPSLSGMASGSGMSGSTAWNNSVRSRLYFERVKRDDGSEDDPDIRVLKLLKANYGQTGSETRVRWRCGVFVNDAGAGSSFGAMAAQARADRVFLDLLDAYEKDGRQVSQTPSANYAPVVFARDPRSDGTGKDGLTKAMNRLFAAGSVRVTEYGPPSRRLRKLVRC